jgi:hypothetical protein
MNRIVFKVAEAAIVAVATFFVLNMLKITDPVHLAVLASVLTTLLYSLIPGGN